mmetsp:Transcript_83003/g.209376  ORF Transcript_83003/g.209376 Transcript_83003/m.209376 type:complete len:301 (-) Transcript_83003:105-1007(-)
MLMGYRDATWSAAQLYFDRAEAFLERMRVFDASKSVSRLQYQKLCRSLASSQGSFEESFMEGICPATISLIRWCRAVSDLLATRYGDFADSGRGGAQTRRSVARSPRGAAAAAAAVGEDGSGRVGVADTTGAMGSQMSPRGNDDGPEDTDDNFAMWPPPRPNLGDLEISPDVYSMSPADLRRVRDLTVRKANVGEVTFPGELDLVRERHVLEELPVIVRLEPGEVLLYPDPGTKPREGEGLNRPATITLFQCKPPAGSLTDADSKARYRERIAKMTEVKGATFVDYDCDRGIWRFRVSHF